MPRKPRIEAYAAAVPPTSVDKKDTPLPKASKGIFTGPRQKLSQDGQTCTYYPDGRVRVSPKVTRWMLEHGWEFAEFRVPIEGYPLVASAAAPPDFAAGTPSVAASIKRSPDSPPATHLVIVGGSEVGTGNILKYRPDGFAEFHEMSMYHNLERVWPTNEWTTPCQIIDDDCVYSEHVNKMGVVVPTHPSAQTRKPDRKRKRGSANSKGFTRARRPEVGDLYGNDEITRLILAVSEGANDDEVRVTFLETDLGPPDPAIQPCDLTIKLSSFRSWVSGGGRLIEASPL